MKTLGLVVLAAGESARMGQPKQLLDYRGTTLLQHALDTALALDGARVAVVLGAHAAEIRARLDESRMLVVENPGWPEGLGSSLRAGLSVLLSVQPDLEAAVFLLCDQPGWCSALLQNLVVIHERTGCAIVASEYEDTLGVPALFARTLFPELLALRGAGGAQQLIRAHRREAVGVPFPAGSVDIDTPADYARLRAADSEPI